VSFRAGGGGFCPAAGGEAMAAAAGCGLLFGDSAEGDHGMEGRALVMLLNDMVLLAGSFSIGDFDPVTYSVKMIKFLSLFF
jgi:hypothetical protein